MNSTHLNEKWGFQMNVLNYVEYVGVRDLLRKSTESISPNQIDKTLLQKNPWSSPSKYSVIKILSLSELPPHAEPDNKNPPEIDLKSEIELDLHAITGSSNDIDLLKFAWKKSSNQDHWTICGGFLLFRITVLVT